MGYACPVCGAPQADGRHLADHLAVTAMVHGDDHEAWLEAHAPDWSGMSPEELGPVVAEHATETDYPQVFEDTTDDHGHSHDQEHSHGHHDGARDQAHADAPSLEEHLARSGRRGPGAGRGDLAAEQRAILEEARAMTEEMLDDGEDERDAGDGERETDDERDAGRDDTDADAGGE